MQFVLRELNWASTMSFSNLKLSCTGIAWYCKSQLSLAMISCDDLTTMWLPSYTHIYVWVCESICVCVHVYCFIYFLIHVTSYNQSNYLWRLLPTWRLLMKHAKMKAAEIRNVSNGTDEGLHDTEEKGHTQILVQLFQRLNTRLFSRSSSMQDIKKKPRPISKGMFRISW